MTRRSHRPARSAGPWSLVALVALVAAPAATTLAAGAPRAPAHETRAAGTAPWRWPLDPRPELRRPFEPPPAPFAAGHRGVDLAGRVGQPVRSAGAGVVAFAGMVAGRSVVSVGHAGGLRTTYEPVTARVAVGDRVDEGDVIGVLSATPGHCLPGSCLHWGLRRGDVYLDPLGLLGVAVGARVRLLPVWGQLRAGRAGLPRADGSRQGRCRRAPIAGRTRAPPRS